MGQKYRSEKQIGFIFCVCTGKCPGLSQMDIWDFINMIRVECPVEYGFIHPMLCDDDGDRFLAEFLRKDRKYMVAGCAPVMQRKLFKEAFEKAGLDISKDLISVDVRNMKTEEALKIVQEALEATEKHTGKVAGTDDV